MSFYEVSIDTIKGLDETGLPSIVKQLLLAEGFKPNVFQLCSNTKAGDGGVDAILQETSKVTLINFFPSTQTVFQIKATEMSAKECADEINDSAHGFLREKLLAGYDFVIVSNKNHVPSKNKQERIYAMQAELDKIGAHSSKPIFLDAEDIQNWVNLHQDVVFMIDPSLHNKWINAGAETFEQWNAKDGRDVFQSDDKLEQQVESIRDRILQNRVTNISGLAGIGKTRTVLEACNRMTDKDKTRIVYIRKCNLRTLIPFLNTLDLNKQFILIIDECDKDYLDAIKREVSNGNVKLVTIDYDSYDNYNELKFNKLSDAVIDAIVKNKAPELDQHTQVAIVKVADGFPRFAINISNEIKEAVSRGDIVQLTSFRDSDIYKLLLKDRAGRYNQAHVDILMVLSLFTKIGYDPHSSNYQYKYLGSKYLADPNEMNKIIEVFGLDKNKVFEVYNEFSDRKIIQQRGQSISVQPFPLAVHLARKWKNGTHPDNVLAFYNALTPILQERFMAKIKFLDDVRIFAQSFIGDKDSPFSDAELLNSPSNELFGELAEMAPDLAMNSIEYAFEDWTSEDLKNNLLNNRREIVWVLEKIMFNKDLYERAAAFLFRLASGENETIGNNATGVLTQTMQILLSPTEASLEQRICLLKSLKPATLHDYSIVLKMIDKGLDNNGRYSCSAGAESQGSRTLTYYNPKNWDEIKNYFCQLTDILISISKSDNLDLRKDVMKIINSNINPIMMDGLFDRYEPFVSEMLSEFQDMVPTFLSNSRFHTEKGFEKLEKYKESLVSKSDDDLDSQFNLYVVPSEFDVGILMSADNDVKFEKTRPLIKQKVEEIADGYLANLDKLYSSLEIFINKDTGNIFDFAARIGSQIGDYKTFVSTLLDMYQINGYENFSLLAISMHEIWKRDAAYIDAVLHELMNDDTWLLKQTIIRFIGTVHDGFLESDLDIILNLVAKEKITPWQLKVGGLSIRLKDSVSPDKTVGFLYKLYEILGPKSCDFIMETMSYYKFKDKEFPREFDSLVINLLKNPQNISEMFNDTMSGYHVNDIIHKITLSDKDAINIFEAFKTATNNDEHYRLDNHGYVGSIVNNLIEKHPNTVIPYILEAMSKEKSRWFARWMRLLGGFSNGKMGSSSSLFSPSLDNLVVKYLEFVNKTVRCNMRNHVIELVNLLHKEDGEMEWSPLIKYLIDTAETKDELEQISANISNYSWSGNTSNYYKQYIPLFEKLLVSPNPLLQSWAKETLDWLRKCIKQEVDREEELGY